MRMRKKKHGAERIEACAELRIADPATMLEGFDKIFGNGNPVHMEIGCGKGNFACGMAKKYPDVNFVAVERVADVCCIALEKAKAAAEERESDNLRFLIGDAKILAENVTPHSLDCIYLNFSDPWPKAGYAKRRLTHVGFLEMYRRALKDGGLLLFKTDNVSLFDFSLEQFEAAGLEVLWYTRDLHNDPHGEGNIMTEYERNFTAKGFTINAAAVRFNKKAD